MRFEKTKFRSEFDIFILIFSLGPIESEIRCFILVVFDGHMLLLLRKSFHKKLIFRFSFDGIILNFWIGFFIRILISVWRSVFRFMIIFKLILVLLINLLKIVLLVVYLMWIVWSRSFNLLINYFCFNNRFSVRSLISVLLLRSDFFSDSLIVLT